jgi:hypothetical protein
MSEWRLRSRDVSRTSDTRISAEIMAPESSFFCRGIAVRLFEFGSIPPGLNQDEASTGYDAFALPHDGIDRNGFHNPVPSDQQGFGSNPSPSASRDG